MLSGTSSTWTSRYLPTEVSVESCRLLYVIGELHTGGTERQLLYLLQAMDRERYGPAVAVWNYKSSDFHVRAIRALGVPLYSLPGNRSSILKLKALRCLVKKLQPKIVHSYSFYTNFAVQYATYGTAAIPVGSLRSDFAWAMKECGPVLGRLSAKWPSSQICNSFSALQSAQSSRTVFAARRLRVVRNGLDMSRFRASPVQNRRPAKILGIGYLYQSSAGIGFCPLLSN